ncbi:hypothetical protein ACFPVX_12700 [Cohnella faecalis]|uniref:Flagellar hook-length control protein FliK n=1 Tax=Cohnella faecalis TaxID=2315694 RepID=A0A398CPQ0_9BACL|nr:hypothetical protein [Cohnella faecalis]RIE03269.1 hypothetical protein D3H35_11285 [Cohnella faecalis]
MSMNIGPMLRALLSEGQPAEGSKALELRIGQIVRGVLLELLDNQEAIVSINGVNVRARLDADMPVGRGTLLQVQTSSGGGLVALKPLADLSEMMPEEGLKDVLKSFSLPEQKWAMELVRGLKKDGYPISRDTASFFASAASLKPATTDSQSWMAASDVAFRRGLAPTEATIGSLRQALFGAPLHESIANVQTELAAWQSSGNAASSEASELGKKLQTLLARGAEYMVRAEAGKEGQPTFGDEAKKSVESSRPQPDGIARNADSARANPRGSAVNVADLSVQENVKAAIQARTDNEGDPIERSAPRSGLAEAGGERASAMPRATTSTSSQENAAAANRQASLSSSERSASGEAASGKTGNSAAEGSRPDGRQPTAAAPRQEGAWIGRFLQWIGAGHERNALHASDQRLGGDLTFPASAGTDLDATAEQASNQHGDSMKSALLALSSRDDIPPALRDAAQTLVNQITGQQLLLASERNGTSPFSHMTLFVPMKTADGETTATVHVQTRRGRRGEWDADNCRLLFDLRMRNLGDTVVDVQVVDRIVSLKLMNDFPGMQDLLEQARNELSSGIREAGFQLLSLTVSPLPSLRSGIEGADGAAGTDNPRGDYPPSSAFASKPYKGVDFRA